ncbi:MAG: hypothetical protein ACR2H1_09330 [Limisphaerales bacterium]
MKNLAIVLIIIGVIMLVYQNIPYTKKHETRVGDLSVSATTKEHVNVPPYIGLIVAGAGVALLLFRKKV